MPIDRRIARCFDTLRAEQRLTRRDLLRAASALAAAAFVPGVHGQTPPPPRVRFVSDPFALGVASGYPTATGVSLWTRLAPIPLAADGGMQPDNVEVRWQVAEDESFARVVGSGRHRAVRELGHSVHVQVAGLRPGRGYFYRFMTGDAVSPVGRTRTLDPAGTTTARLRLGLGSCQNFEQGFFAAHRHLLADDIDLMVFVGDYIYESNWGDDLVRRHLGAAPVTRDQYRVRHAQYRCDPDLQRLHAAVPWLLTWDDHEVENDYAGEQGEHLDPDFLARRAAAYQAYYEHLPLPMRGRGADLPLYTRVDVGDLARIHLLDNRQYRSTQVCADPFKGGGSTDAVIGECAGLNDRSRTMLGSTQERWLADGLRGRSARWNVIAQQTLVAPLPTPREGGRRGAWTDGWDGYPAARARLIDALTGSRAANPVILGGDLHTTVVADLHRDPGDVESPIVAAEFCGTSINAQGWSQASYDARKAISPHVHHVDAERRGYLLLELTPDRLDVALRGLDTVKTPDGKVSTVQRWGVVAGEAGVQR